jgi:O-antigen ligase
MRAQSFAATAPASPRSSRLSRSARAFVATDGERLSLVRDPLRLLLFALTVLTVSQLHQHYPMMMKLRPALLLVVASTGYAFLNPRYLTHAKVWNVWPMRLVAFLGILACCSAVFGISLGRTASFIISVYVKVIVYSFLLAFSIRHVRDLFTLVWGYVVGCGILAFFSLFIFGIARTNSGFARLDHLYMYDANDLGVIMMVGMPLVMLLLSVSRGSQRWMLISILVAIAATIARSGSRGGFLGFIAVGVGSLLLANGVSLSKRIALILIAPIALALGAPAGYWKQMGTVMQPKADYNYSTIDGRKAVAERGIGYMAKYPIFGLGMNNFARAECTISPKLEGLSRTGPIRCTAPHNSYVQAGAELGVPGLIVWVSLEMGLVVVLLRLRRRLPRKWKRGTGAERFLYGATTYFPLSMIGFAVTSFFVSFAWMEPLYIMAAFTTGLYVSLREHARLQNGGHAQASIPPVAGQPGRGWRVARSASRAQPLVRLGLSAESDPCAAS